MPFYSTILIRLAKCFIIPRAVMMIVFR